MTAQRIYQNTFTMSIGPPLYFDEVIDHVYAGEWNDFEWWNVLPEVQPPEHHGFLMEERDGRELVVEVFTIGEPLTGWAGRIALFYPVLSVRVEVDGVLAGLWRDGVRAIH